ncbi:uncharacterized protein DEA37_0006577 [Paragonimus westermani]|uniref:Uncharacterized protein n=1 Tax=Paragonimus westermani TaxID=34504 RepID=A0A5J4NEF7_9TREM|nr:uncharacterized protein DEA37_0006577 [Paragonimus westermani]
MADIFCGVNHRRSSEPIGSSTSRSDGTRGVITGQEHIPIIEVSRHRSGGAIVPGRQDSLDPPLLSSQHPMVSVFPRYRTVTRVVYNGLPFPSVEAVVTAIVAHPGPWHPESPPDVDPPNGATALLEENRSALPDFDEQIHSPHTQNAEAPDSSSFVHNLHGSALYSPTRKPFFRTGDTRRNIYVRPFCFGLLLHGSSVGDREELVFSVDPPSSPCSVCFPSTTSTTNNLGASNYSAARPQHCSSPCDLDPSTYAGRLDDTDASPTTSLAHSSVSHQTFDPSVRLSPTQCIMGFGTDASGAACSHRQVVSMDTIFTRWQRFIRLHCRNTRVDSANEENFDRRQTLLRCYRTLDVKVHNAKLLPANWCKSRRDESCFWLMIDGVEIARAYVGSSTVSILIE